MRAGPACQMSVPLRQANVLGQNYVPELLILTYNAVYQIDLLHFTAIMSSVAVHCVDPGK